MGFALKLGLILLAVLIAAFNSGGLNKVLSLSDLRIAYPNGISSVPVISYIFALVIAPVIENLLLPVLKRISHAIKSPNVVTSLFIVAGAYFAHGKGSGGLTGATLFVVLFYIYVFNEDSFGKVTSYWLTVITHFSFNLSVFLMIGLINFLIFL